MLRKKLSLLLSTSYNDTLLSSVNPLRETQTTETVTDQTNLQTISGNDTPTSQSSLEDLQMEGMYKEKG